MIGYYLIDLRLPTALPPPYPGYSGRANYLVVACPKPPKPQTAFNVWLAGGSIPVP